MNNPLPETKGPQELETYQEEPHSLEAEAVLLGALLRDEALIEDIDWLQEDCWYNPAHRTIFELLVRLSKTSGYNFVTVKNLLKSDPDLLQVGGIGYLSELYANLFPKRSVPQLAELILELYLRRRCLKICEDHAASARARNGPKSSEILEQLEMDLFHLAERKASGGEVLSLNDAMDQSLNLIRQARLRGSKLSGVTTGFEAVDDCLHGLHASDLIIIAGRPGMGKTAFATNLALNAARAWKMYQNDDGTVVEEGAYVLFFSLEMSTDQLAMRILSQEAGVSSSRLRGAVDETLRDEEIEEVISSAGKLHDTPLFIDDSPNLTVAQIFQRSRRFKRRNQGRLGLIIIDYLQLIKPDSGKNYRQKVQEVTDISRDLKLLARELKVPVVAISQMSRDVEKRAHKRPQLSDLRESGALEQDADIVMFLYREEYYLRQSPPIVDLNESNEAFLEKEKRFLQRQEEVRGKADLIIAKHRHGTISDIEMRFDPELSSFYTSD